MIVELHNRDFWKMLLLACTLFVSSCSTNRQFKSLQRFQSKTGKTFVFGKVIDNHGISLAGAIIQGANLKNRTQTDRDGHYFLELTDNSREIKAFWIGYKSYETKGVKLATGDSLQLNLTMIESEE